MLFRIALYFGFILFAAPIDSVLDVWSGYGLSDAQQMAQPLAEALIYIYAFILAVETIFRVEQHDDVIVSRPFVCILQLLDGIVIALFMIDYLGVLMSSIVAHKSVIDSANRLAGCIALFSSILSFIVCERSNRATLNVPTG